ncbi:hypothetical protein C8J57DRAFT_1240968 [Mycena rebaudengoi]|nr:hypothetical protein C8J57DRAFT_1240968 [Mycena rebaudengoi]
MHSLPRQTVRTGSSNPDVQLTSYSVGDRRSGVDSQPPAEFSGQGIDSCVLGGGDQNPVLPKIGFVVLRSQGRCHIVRKGWHPQGNKHFTLRVHYVLGIVIPYIDSQALQNFDQPFFTGSFGFVRVKEERDGSMEETPGSWGVLSTVYPIILSPLRPSLSWERLNRKNLSWNIS